MKLVCALFFFCATNNINLLTEHIPGIFNCDAEDLSRLQVTAFHLIACLREIFFIIES